MNWPDVIQAFGAVASVALAFWIARLTSRYAQSTSEIVRANQETLHVLREELNELRDERRAPVTNAIDRLESAVSSCVARGLESMTADDLRETAPHFSVRNHELVKEVGRRDHKLAGMLVRAYDLGSEAERHLILMSAAKGADRQEMIDAELSQVKRTLTILSQTLTAARDRLARY